MSASAETAHAAESVAESPKEGNIISRSLKKIIGFFREKIGKVFSLVSRGVNKIGNFFSGASDDGHGAPAGATPAPAH